MDEIFKTLNNLNIKYEVVNHKPVFMVQKLETLKTK